MKDKKNGMKVLGMIVLTLLGGFSLGAGIDLGTASLTAPGICAIVIGGFGCIVTATAYYDRPLELTGSTDLGDEEEII